MALAAVATFVPLLTVSPASASSGWRHKSKPATVAVLGDVPYSQGQVDGIDLLVDEINSRRPNTILHVGDTKSGSTRCDDSHYESGAPNGPLIPPPTRSGTCLTLGEVPGKTWRWLTQAVVTPWP